MFYSQGKNYDIVVDFVNDFTGENSHAKSTMGIPEKRVQEYRPFLFFVP